jgi:hypothetical protein
MPTNYIEIQDYAGKKRDLKAHAYNIQSDDGDVLAHIFTYPETFTIAWGGTKEFDSSLEFFILERLPELIFDDYLYPLTLPFRVRFPYKAQQKIFISLIIHENEITSSEFPQEDSESSGLNPQLKQFQIFHNKKELDFTEALSQPNKISFARIDYNFELAGWWATPSFTAENPKSHSSGIAEIAFKFHRSYRCPTSLLNFISQTSNPMVSSGIEEALSELIYSQPSN